MSRKKGNQPRPQAATPTRDSFANFQARLGWGADNQASAASYTLTYQSRNRIWLEAAYRGSWIVGKAVDAPAEDMTRAGIEMSGMEPGDIEAIEKGSTRLAIWDKLCDTIKWSRLYGGAIAVMLIDGQDMATPLRPETVGKGAFKGLLVLDRWMVNPSTSRLITDFGPDMGLPMFYDVLPAAGMGLSGKRVHHSRVLRLEGCDLPFYQKIAENYWGLSVLEPMWDRLIAFDSATVGASQLVYKAHLRTMKIKELRKLLAAGGPAIDALKKNIEFIRATQTNEGITVIDADDTFEVNQYTFSGLSDMIIQFGQQLSGATGIPLTRLFGQSPIGMNSNGDGEMKQYHEEIGQKQERRLRNPLHRLLEVMSYSRLGKKLPDSFQFSFRPLEQMSETEKADVADKTTNAVTNALDAGVIDVATAQKELKTASHTTGIFGNITDEMIKASEEAGPPAPETDMPEIPDLSQTKDSFWKRFIKRQ